MGSDLYNNLIRYFVAHLKGLRDVSPYSFTKLPLLMRHPRRKQTRYRTKPCYDITLRNGIGIRQARTISIGFSRT